MIEQIKSFYINHRFKIMVGLFMTGFIVNTVFVDSDSYNAVEKIDTSYADEDVYINNEIQDMKQKYTSEECVLSYDKDKYNCMENNIYYQMTTDLSIMVLLWGLLDLIFIADPKLDRE